MIRPFLFYEWKLPQNEDLHLLFSISAALDRCHLIMYDHRRPYRQHTVQSPRLINRHVDAAMGA